MPLLQKAYLGSTALFTEKDWWEDESRLVLDTGSATATASATVNTKGSWVQLIASTSANSSLLSIDVSGVSVSNTSTATLLDIGTGASGSETVLLSNIAVGSARGSAVSANRINLNVPIKIASGTRIAARIQGERASQTAVIDVATVNAGDYATAPTAVDTYGGDTATSKGASFTGTSWTQVTASTSQACRAIVAVPSMATGGARNNVTTFTFDIGVGASGSEVVFGKVRCTASNAEFLEPLLPYATIFARAIPSGSRLAIKSSSNVEIDDMGMTLIAIP